MARTAPNGLGLRWPVLLGQHSCWSHGWVETGNRIEFWVNSGLGLVLSIKWTLGMKLWLG